MVTLHWVFSQFFILARRKTMLVDNKDAFNSPKYHIWPGFTHPPPTSCFKCKLKWWTANTPPLPLLWSHPSLTTVTSFMLGQNTLWTGRGCRQAGGNCAKCPYWSGARQWFSLKKGPYNVMPVGAGRNKGGRWNAVNTFAQIKMYTLWSSSKAVQQTDRKRCTWLPWAT